MTEQWQELKETITEMRDNDGTGTQQDVCKFLVNYMETLEKQMQEPCEDCISRQAAIDVASGYCHPANIADELRKLPSAQPERKKGKWIRHDEIKNVYGGICIECSECGEKYVVQHILDEKYCRNCGADMRGEQDARLNQQTGGD